MSYTAADGLEGIIHKSIQQSVQCFDLHGNRYKHYGKEMLHYTPCRDAWPSNATELCALNQMLLIAIDIQIARNRFKSSGSARSLSPLVVTMRLRLETMLVAEDQHLQTSSDTPDQFIMMFEGNKIQSKCNRITAGIEFAILVGSHSRRFNFSVRGF